MRIILDKDAADFLYSQWEEWNRVAKDRQKFPNWEQSADDREARRECIVYGNCAGVLCLMLRNASDGIVNDNWWDRLHNNNTGPIQGGVGPAPRD